MQPSFCSCFDMFWWVPLGMTSDFQSLESTKTNGMQQQSFFVFFPKMILVLFHTGWTAADFECFFLQWSQHSGAWTCVEICGCFLGTRGKEGGRQVVANGCVAVKVAPPKFAPPKKTVGLQETWIDKSFFFFWGGGKKSIVRFFFKVWMCFLLTRGGDEQLIRGLLALQRFHEGWWFDTARSKGGPIFFPRTKWWCYFVFFLLLAY